MVWHLRKTFGTAIDVGKETGIFTVVIGTRNVRCEDIDLERLGHVGATGLTLGCLT